MAESRNFQSQEANAYRVNFKNHKYIFLSKGLSYSFIYNMGPSLICHAFLYVVWTSIRTK